MAPFMPRGDRSQRVIVAELAAQADYGDELTYDDLGYALGFDGDDDRPRIRQAVAAARDTITVDHNKALVAVRGQGYRVARPGEHAGLAQHHRQKADRQISRAFTVVTHVDETRMTPEEIRRNNAYVVLIGDLQRRMNGAEDRLNRLEAIVLGDRRPPVIPGEVEPDSA